MKVSFIEVRAELKPFIQSIWVIESPGGMPASDSNFAAPNGCPKLIVTLDNTIRSTAHGAALVSREGGCFLWEIRIARHSLSHARDEHALSASSFDRRGPTPFSGCP
jgi:hypothetical protein